MTSIVSIGRWVWREIVPVAALGIAAAALLGFINIVDAIRDGEASAFDETVLRMLRNPNDLADPIGPWWVEAAFRDITAIGGTTVLTLLTIATIGYLLFDRQRHAALLVMVSIGGGTIMSTLLKNVFARPRPELVAHLVEVRTLSFPSGHAMLSAVTFLTLGALLTRVHARKRVKAYILGLAVLLTTLVGMSRVYLGVHWPTDVLAGWCAGAAWATLCWLVALYLQRRGTVESNNETGEPNGKPT